MQVRYQTAPRSDRERIISPPRGRGGCSWRANGREDATHDRKNEDPTGRPHKRVGAPEHGETKAPEAQKDGWRRYSSSDSEDSIDASQPRLELTVASAK